MQAPPQPRQFQGFNAGGQWHPWGAPPPENEREQRQQADSNAAGGLVIPGQSGLVTSPAPLERDTTPMQLNHPITGHSGPAPPAPTPVRQIIPVPNKTPPEAKEGASTTSSGSAPSGSGSGLLGSTPREAAALAALRRFQAGRSTESLKPPAPAPAAGASPALTPGTPTPTPSKTVPEVQGSGSGSNAGPISPSRGSGQAPALIPLYNPGAALSAGGPGMSSPSPYFAGASSASTPLIDLRPHASSLPRSPPPPFGQSSGSSAYFAPSQLAAQAQPQGGLPRPGQLPPNLTDAQLGQLDRLTRESIDERLRVLEGVQSTVWRCVEDLTRLRSALPETATGTDPLRLGGGARTGSSVGASGSRETSIGSSIGSSFGVEIQRELTEANGGGGSGDGDVDVKGKGKDVAGSSGEEHVIENGDAS
ncbi:hypothetical protein BDV93DRAFT_364588 [Ceratobasidium sp. AG-I]|nr:hypothetical protein BDV93DRAFT_364588 [Ceratobasidium sp. AG-I]